MGKWIWGGIALSICSAVGVYVVARPSCNPSGYVVSSCAAVASDLARNCNPVNAISALVHQGVSETASTAVTENERAPGAIVIEDWNDDEQRTRFQEGYELAFGEEETTPEAVAVVPIAETRPERMPYADEVSTDEPPAGDDCCHEGGVCSWFRSFFEGLAQLMNPDATQESAEEASEPEEPIDEPENPYGLPSMREDPHYHHHYPSCPYTGRCPYPQSQPVPQVRPVEKTPAVPATPEQPAKPKQSKVSSLNGSSAEAQPAVDTMECRPTDLPGRPRANRPF